MPRLRRPQRCEAQLEQRTGHLVSVAWDGFAREAEDGARQPAQCVSGRCSDAWLVAPSNEMIMSARRTRARGDQELSARKRSETEGAGDSRRSRRSTASERNAHKQRSSDLGRALRSVYDETLREAVPDDFLNLLGKLS
jgi:hypothetical protein